MESRENLNDGEAKAAYAPPMLVDYGLLAKEAAATAAGSGSDSANNYS